MNFKERISRRSACRMGAAAAVVPMVTGINPVEAAIRPKRPGETLVLYLGGDYWHNGMTQEIELRRTLADTGWRLVFANQDCFVTPEVLAATDLLIMLRTSSPNFLGYTPETLVEDRPTCKVFTAEQEDAIIDNIRGRGMGFVAMHATCCFAYMEKFRDLMGVECIMHGPQQTVEFSGFDPDHPITRGIEQFSVDLDENFGVKIVDDHAVPLFMSHGTSDGRDDIAGWCIEAGKGRIAGLLAGHANTAWSHPVYRELHWRAAHWALRRDIPPFKVPGDIVFG